MSSPCGNCARIINPNWMSAMVSCLAILPVSAPVGCRVTISHMLSTGMSRACTSLVPTHCKIPYTCISTNKTEGQGLSQALLSPHRLGKEHTYGHTCLTASRCAARSCPLPGLGGEPDDLCALGAGPVGQGYSGSDHSHYADRQADDPCCCPYRGNGAAGGHESPS